MSQAEDEELYAFFYETVVLPYVTYSATRKEPTWGTRKDWKAAMAAASPAYHFREHLPPAYQKNHAAIVALCADYALLGDVVNASKHKHLTRGKPQITSVDSIHELMVSTTYEDAAGPYVAVTKAIDLALKDGTTRELFDVLTNVVNMWTAFLQAAGIPGTVGRFPHEDRNRVISREEAGQINLEITQGLAAKVGLKVQKYNYQKGCPEPVNLAGSKFTFAVYDPRAVKTQLEIAVTSPQGKKYAASVELDADEKIEFVGLKGQVQHDAFINKIVKRRGEVVLHSDQTDLPGPDTMTMKYRPPQDEPRQE